MTHGFRVRIEKERLVFSAAHFITYDDDVCEPLHGHNYHVTAEVHGPLEANHYVVDFVALTEALAKIVAGLDHRMLLPTQHPTIRVESVGDETRVAHGKRRWVFPTVDCVLLPVANTTAERLAQWIGHQLLESLQQRLGQRPEALEIAVDECDGQWGIWSSSSE